MKTFLVPAKFVTTILYRVRAATKEDAMNMVLDNDGGLTERSIDEGDLEVYYPDIQEVGI